MKCDYEDGTGTECDQPPVQFWLDQTERFYGKVWGFCSLHVCQWLDAVEISEKEALVAETHAE